MISLWEISEDRKHSQFGSKFFKNVYFIIITADFEVGQVHVYETGINFETTFICLEFRLY